MIRKPFRDRSRKGKYLLAKKIKINENVNAENPPENVKIPGQNLTRFVNSAVCENPVPSTSGCQNLGQDDNNCIFEEPEYEEIDDDENEEIEENNDETEEIEENDDETEEIEENDNDENEEIEENDNVNEEIEENDNENASDGDSNDEEEQFNDNRPLYAGASITVAQSMLLILSLVLKHNLTGTAIADIITVINLHCLNEAFQKNSLYKFKKYFSWSTDNFCTKHYYCSVCTTSLATKNSICETCQANKGISYFIEMPFIKQLTLMFQRNGFRELLQHRFHREGGLRPNSFRDIYDGSLYQQYVQNGFLSNPNNISFTWYTDGIPVFKSSHVSMWPVYLTINELPYKLRMKRENTLLVGLWFGSNKPSANHFMYKFRPKFETLFRGQIITLPGQNVITVRGIILAGTCDLPAKAQFLNMMQYNGEFGCNHCKDKGESFRHPTGGTSRVYPYNRYPVMRTSAETLENANQALQDMHPVNGVKGPCALSKLMPDFIRGTAIDYMHCIFPGVVKKLLQFWFDPSFSGEPFSLCALSGVVDSRLTRIKPPKFVHRMPRTVLDLCHWKASELKMWFFYYSIVILEGIMNPIYFRHYLLLVSGISLLNSSCVTVKNVEDAESLLHKFVRECPTLYGLQFCSINIHQILHLPDCVRRLGPLWVYSCFPYEDINGKILKLVHGTTNIESQIASAHIFLIKMRRKLDQLPEGPIRDFTTDFKHQVKIRERIAVGCYSVGSYKRILRLPLYIQQALINSNLPLENVHTYLRLLKDSKLFIGEMYNRAESTISSRVVYEKDREEKLGVIHCFVKISECDCGDHCICEGEHFAIITEIVKDGIFHVRADELQVGLSHLHKCHRGNVIVAIPIAFLKSVCIHINVDNQFVIGQVINSVELE
ncbi:uncharacterized protein LOC143895532 isoform X2 [Temnothorax americanus]